MSFEVSVILSNFQSLVLDIIYLATSQELAKLLANFSSQYKIRSICPVLKDAFVHATIPKKLHLEFSDFQ